MIGQDIIGVLFDELKKILGTFSHLCSYIDPNKPRIAFAFTFAHLITRSNLERIVCNAPASSSQTRCQSDSSFVADSWYVPFRVKAQDVATG
jgi:hypothetical protein